MTNPYNKPFVVIDLDSGRYLADNEGHEKYNETPNLITGCYYGYAPPHGKINIQALGAKKSDLFIDGILVIYVKKQLNSNNRIISSFIENAKIHRNLIFRPELKRTAKKGQRNVDCGYSIESKELTVIDHIPSARPFVIKLNEWNQFMFRHQRFYSGKYPELDKLIIDYITSLSVENSGFSEETFQQEIQTPLCTNDEKALNNSSVEPTFATSNDQRVSKCANVSKTALRKAGYQCEYNRTHTTFENRSGNQYMEGHHLIPCTPDNVRYFWQQFHVNIDCVENIVCVCPTCHRQIHYGSHEARQKILKTLYDLKAKDLSSIGVHLAFDDLMALYQE